MFMVIRLEQGARDGVPLLDSDGKVHIYATGAEAAADAALLSSQWTKYQPRRVAEDGWREREAGRFADGTYLTVPWFTETWWIGSEPNRDHYAHVSNDDAAQIAFTPDAEKGAGDRQTRMAPGRYLAKFFPGLSSADVASWAAKWGSEHGTGIELLFAATADEIQEVYENGPTSCMSHDASDYDSPIHPVRVYAAGDLQIAYLKRGDAITARTLCWPEKKIFARIYGDYERLSPLLEEAGYRDASYEFEGARLLRREHNGGFVAPYLDVVRYVSDAGDYLRIGGDLSCDSTNGLIEDEGCSCERCGDRMGRDEGNYMEDVEESWCDDCERRYSFYCDRYGQTFTGDDYVRMANGETWSADAFAEHGAECEGSGDCIPADDTVELEDGTIWSDRYFHLNGFVCEDTGGNYSNEDLVVYEGAKLSPDAAADRQDAAADDIETATLPALEARAAADCTHWLEAA